MVLIGNRLPNVGKTHSYDERAALLKIGEHADVAAAFTISANNMRRHMSNDARLLCAAFARPEPVNKGGRGKLSDYTDSLGVTGMTAKSARD